MQPHTFSTPLAALLLAAAAAGAGFGGSAMPHVGGSATPAAGVQLLDQAATGADCVPLPCPVQQVVADPPGFVRPPEPPVTTPHTAELAGHSWLSDRVELLYRRTSLTSDERAMELLETGGIELLIREARSAGHAATHSRYFVVAASDPTADGYRIGRLFEAGLPDAGAARTAVLLAVGEWMRGQARVEPWIFNAHLEATVTVRPGSARRRAMADLLSVPALDGAQVAHAIRTIGRVTNSSAARADLLIAAAAGRTLTGEARSAWIRTARAIPVRSQRDRALAVLR